MKLSARDVYCASVASIKGFYTGAHSAAALTRITQLFALINPQMVFYGAADLCLQG